MELQAIIEGLSALKKPCSVTVRTDSIICAYLLNGRGKRASKRENQDMVQRVLQLKAIHSVTAEWVKGHHTDPDNCLADQLCDAALTAG